MSLVGVGIDIMDVARMARLLDQYGDRFVGRWFTPAEVDWCQGNGRRSAAFAAVMAGKEAVWKALRLEDSSRPVPWRSLEVIPEGRGGRVTLPFGLAPETSIDMSVGTGADFVVAYALAWTGLTPAGADATLARLRIHHSCANDAANSAVLGSGVVLADPELAGAG